MLWLMDGAEVVATRAAPPVPGPVPAPVPGAWAEALAAALAGWPALPVLGCGLPLPDGASIAAPCAPDLAVAQMPGLDGRLRMLGGVAQGGGADLPSGAAVRVAGLMAALPDYDGVVCLPGARSHWVRISAGEICHFQTLITPAAQAALAGVTGAAGTADPAAPGFAEAVNHAISRPHQAWAGLAAADATGLLGTLIGFELGATRPYWLGQRVTVIAPPGPGAAWCAALAAQGADAPLACRDATTRAGLYAAWRRLGG